jgi:thioredoxin reductase (NADPH)/alkyl hydroperoxide reductase subunit F
LNTSKPTPVDIVVIGGGPGGCSAAVNAHCLGLSVRLVEKGDLGGQVRRIQTIRNLVGGPYAGTALADALASQIVAYGIPVTRARAMALSRADDLWMIHCDGGETLYARAIIAATGTRELLLAEHPSVHDVHDEYEDQFIYWVPLEDLLRGKVVIVGSDRVLLSLMDDQGERLRGANIRVLALPDKWYVIEPHIDDLPFEVTRVDSVDHVTPLAAGYDIGYTVSGGATGRLTADLLLTNLGKSPNSALFEGYMERDVDGYLVPKDYLRQPGVVSAYAVGDVAHKSFQRISVAIGEGASAALDYFYREAQAYSPRGQ